MDVSVLPTVNASLNGTSTLLLLAGYAFIRRKQIPAHKTCMITAGITSALFLASYLVYHFHAGSVPFKGQGFIRAVYFAILISHVLLAMVIAVMVPITFWRALKGQFERHRAIARVTFPIWLYVSVTGVVIYVMLYIL